MSSRAEEKARRREEREAAERAAQSSEQRRKRIAFAGGGVLLAAIAVIVVLALAAGGDEGSNATIGDTAVPARRIADLNAAAKAAGCTVKTWPSEGQTHEARTFTAKDYKTNPPTSGTHFPQFPKDGIYTAGNEPPLGQLVHTLEHGRVDVQYKPGTPTSRVNQLEALFNEKLKGTAGYHQLLFQNTSGMPSAVAATAWTQSLTCPSWNDKVFDAIRAFREKYVDKGPEFIP